MVGITAIEFTNERDKQKICNKGEGTVTYERYAVKISLDITLVLK